MPDAPPRTPWLKCPVQILPELLLFGLVPVMIALFVLCGPSDHAREILFQTGGIKGPAFFLLAGPLAIKLLLFGLILYIPWRTCDLLLEKGANNTGKARVFCVSGVCIYGGFLLNNLGNNLLLTLLSVTPRERVASASWTLLECDRSIFGEYIPFTIGRYIHPEIIDLSVSVYFNYSTLYVIGFFLSLIHSCGVFRRFYVSFGIWVLLALPLWLLFPAISPDEMFRQNILGGVISGGPSLLTTSINEMALTPQLQAALKEMSTIWSNASSNTFAISCFPSFHVGGTLLISMTLMRIDARTLIATIPFVLLTALGATVTLQHYAVDFLPAILISWISVALTDRWLAATESQNGTTSLFRCIETIQQDVRRLWYWIAPRYAPR